MGASRLARWVIASALALGCACASTPAVALPLGRAWAPMDTTKKVPGHTRLYPDRLDLDSLNRMVLIAEGAGGVGYDKHFLRWQDSTWVLLASLGQSLAYCPAVISTGPGFPLIWQTADEIYDPRLPYLGTYLVMSAIVDDRFATVHDTIAVIDNHTFGYSAAASPRRRWAIKHDYTNGVRLWYSDTVRVWHKTEVPGVGSYGVVVAPMNDTTALCVWAGSSEPPTWGLLEGSAWRSGGLVPGASPNLPLGYLRLRRSPDGTLWLGWSTDWAFTQLTRYVDGAWVPAESLTCKKRYAGQYASRDLAVSRDGWPQPVVAWIEHDVDAGFTGTLCVCVPTDSGYPVAEELPGTDDAWRLDALRDLNGDVWVVWQTEFDGLFWTHSHVTAVASAPRFDESKQRPALRWTLSGSAPGSFWSVLRAVGSSGFEPVARLARDRAPRWPGRTPAPLPAGYFAIGSGVSASMCVTSS